MGRKQTETLEIIQSNKKNGINRTVRIVIKLSSARPTLSIPTQFSIQKIRKPAWPNVRSKGSLNARLSRE